MLNEYITYLNGQQVRDLAVTLAPTSIVKMALLLHQGGGAILPAEATLYWPNSLGETARALSLPAMLGGRFEVAGVKLINGIPSNAGRGLPRASGLTLLFNELTARPFAIMEGGYLSALRTASVSALAVDFLGRPGATVLSVIGAGVLADAHIRLLLEHHSFRKVILFDLDRNRAAHLREALRPVADAAGAYISIAKTAQEAVENADVIVPTTTATEGYIHDSWLRLGSLVVNVSLDDVVAEAVLATDLLVVDSWELCKADDRRLLGRMFRAGQIVEPGGTPQSGLFQKSVDAELGEVLNGTKPGRIYDEQRIICNPFGMAIGDIALACEIYRAAIARGIGIHLPV